MEITWRAISGEQERGAQEGKGTGIKKHKWQVQNRQGEVKNSMGNGEVKEFLCVTHGHELRSWGGGEQNGGGRGIKRRKEQDNCNSIINKIYLLKKKSYVTRLLLTFNLPNPYDAVILSPCLWRAEQPAVSCWEARSKTLERPRSSAATCPTPCLLCYTAPVLSVLVGARVWSCNPESKI